MSGTHPGSSGARPRCVRWTGAVQHDDIPRIAVCSLCGHAVVLTLAAIRRAGPAPCPWTAHPSTMPPREAEGPDS